MLHDAELLADTRAWVVKAATDLRAAKISRSAQFPGPTPKLFL
jgi:hypothetical protein